MPAVQLAARGVQAAVWGGREGGESGTGTGTFTGETA